jgi:hypothetical protein
MAETLVQRLKEFDSSQDLQLRTAKEYVCITLMRRVVGLYG